MKKVKLERLVRDAFFTGFHKEMTKHASLLPALAAAATGAGGLGLGYYLGNKGNQAPPSPDPQDPQLPDNLLETMSQEQYPDQEYDYYPEEQNGISPELLQALYYAQGPPQYGY